MIRLVASYGARSRVVDHAKCDNEPVFIAISNGLGLKSVGYCFQFLEFHTYNNKIVFITVLYIPHSSIYST